MRYRDAHFSFGRVHGDETHATKDAVCPKALRRLQNDYDEGLDEEYELQLRHQAKFAVTLIIYFYFYLFTHILG